MPDQIPAWAGEKAREVLAMVHDGYSGAGQTTIVARALVAAKLDGWREAREAADEAMWKAIDPSTEGTARKCAERARVAIRSIPDPEETVDE